MESPAGTAAAANKAPPSTAPALGKEEDSPPSPPSKAKPPAEDSEGGDRTPEAVQQAEPPPAPEPANLPPEEGTGRRDAAEGAPSPEEDAVDASSAKAGGDFPPEEEEPPSTAPGATRAEADQDGESGDNGNGNNAPLYAREDYAGSSISSISCSAGGDSEEEEETDVLEPVGGGDRHGYDGGCGCRHRDCCYGGGCVDPYHRSSGTLLPQHDPATSGGGPFSYGGSSTTAAMARRQADRQHHRQQQQQQPAGAGAAPTGGGVRGLVGNTTASSTAATDAIRNGRAGNASAMRSVHFGDDNFEVVDEYGEATWGEVCETCCCHTAGEWLAILLGAFAAVFFLYWFLFALDLLSLSAKVMTGCVAGQLFGDDVSNPIAALMIGILATVLLQSSSMTTSIIVSLVGEDNVISVNQAIYMVMGANIGTSITNTLVAMGQIGDRPSLERAFAGATVHDMFNFMTVAVLLPVEVITNYLLYLTAAIVDPYAQVGSTTTNATNSTDQPGYWVGPVARAVLPLANLIIMPNKNLIHAVADGSGSCEVGGGFYPIECYDPSAPTYDTCSKRGLIDCNKRTNACPAFFDPDATPRDDKVSGGVIFFFALCMLFLCLFCLIAVLQKLLLGLSTRIVYKATDVNAYFAMLIGAAITVVVQSSSITTSTLTPLVGIGIIRLEQMFSLTVGCNLGTTVTAIMAAMVSEGSAALQVALAHLFFNVSGIVLFFFIPFMRRIPVYAARQLGKAASLWRMFPFIYIVSMFFAVPLVFLGLSFMFEQHTAGLTVAASLITVLLAILCLWIFLCCNRRGGSARCSEYFRNRERERVVLLTLPDDIDYLLDVVEALIRHTGYFSESDGGEDEEGERHSSGGGAIFSFVPCIRMWQQRRRLIRRLPDDMEYLRSTISALIDHSGLPLNEWCHGGKKEAGMTNECYSEELVLGLAKNTVDGRHQNNSQRTSGVLVMGYADQEYLANPVGRRPSAGITVANRTGNENCRSTNDLNRNSDSHQDSAPLPVLDESVEEDDDEEDDIGHWRYLPYVFYLLGLFVVLPLVLYGVTLMFKQNKLSLTSMASFICIAAALSTLYVWYSCRVKSGEQQYVASMLDWQRKRDVLRDLPEDLAYLKSKTAALIRHTNLCELNDNHIDFGEDGQEDESTQ